MNRPIMKNYVIEMLKTEEVILEGELENPTSDLSIPLDVYLEVIRNQLQDVYQAIADLEEIEMQKEMKREAGK